MLKNIEFEFYTGSGNDFIIINNFNGELNVDEIRPLIPKVCARGVSIGADGFIVLERSDEADFEWRLFNPDGSVPEMCGNGSRCAARYAYLNGIANKTMRFKTVAGIIRAEIKEGTNVKVELTKPSGMLLDKDFELAGKYNSYCFVNTGVPHVVLYDDDLDNAEVGAIGRIVRFHNLFSPKGTNVNFAKVTGESSLRIRTYERGVEGETLACGTGATACAVVSCAKGLLRSPVKVTTSGGLDLTVYVESDAVFLEGEARRLSKGVIFEDAYAWRSLDEK
jgi:diaminopimelate epimerase